MIEYGRDYESPAGWDDVVKTLRSVPAEAEKHRGQVRIAYRLAARHADDLMYVYGIGWFHWDGKRWAEDHQGKAKLAVLETLQAALAESLEDRTLREDVRKCETASGIGGVLDIASALEPFAFTVEHLDSDPNMLNTQTGVLDLATGELLAHDPAYRCTKITHAGYSPTVANGHTWHTFLEQALPDLEVRGYFQRLIGLALLGAVRENILPIATGSGGNGKGVAYGAVLHALGGYAYAAENDLFTSAKANANAASPALMGLRGMRLVVVSETERDQPLAEALMKIITGGDPITARPLYGKPVTFQPSHTALLVTNHLPKVSGDDEAIWRRLRVVPFNVSFRNSPDTSLGERLRGEADDILAWAIEGWRQYQARGLAEPESVRVATGDYRKSNDAVARFIDDICTLAPHVHVGHRELFSAWRSWCADTGELPGTERDFGAAIQAHGHMARRTKIGKRYGGIALLAEAGDDGDDNGYNFP
jgi:putative DNA primase/helicase